MDTNVAWSGSMRGAHVTLLSKYLRCRSHERPESVRKMILNLTLLKIRWEVLSEKTTK